MRLTFESWWVSQHGGPPTTPAEQERFQQAYAGWCGCAGALRQFGSSRADADLLERAAVHLGGELNTLPDPKHLPVPPPVQADAEATEALRLWTIRGGNFAQVRPGCFPPFQWGMVLVDLARHVARCGEEGGGWESDSPHNPPLCTQGEILEEIRLGFDAEWATSTDSGGAWEADS